MDRSSGRLPDPVAWPPEGDRRRRVRQKLYTPVYASFNGPQTGMVVDLSELLDLHEEGFAVQTSERLEMNRAVTLCLDLPETRNFIHGCGEVVWSDDAGRGGIRFSALSENSRQILREWLFANLLIGCSNLLARTEQLALRKEEEESTASSTQPLNKPSNVVSISSSVATTVETGRAPSDPRETAVSLDAIFQQITDRAVTLTGATGAALAFLTDDQIICRAQTGEPSLPLGSQVDTKRGLSAECIHSGVLVSCEDTENDSRVDAELCRALGIGSLMAVPIVSDFRVVGLLEVFSPHPRAFTNAHATTLERLVESSDQSEIESEIEKEIESIRIESEPEIESEEAQLSTPPTESVNVVAPQLPTELPVAVAPPQTAEDPIFVPGYRSSDTAHPQKSITPLEAEDVSAIIAIPVPSQDPDILETAPALSEYEQVVAEKSYSPEPAPTVRSRRLHWALLWSALAVVSLALGYLLGPIIERRWPTMSREVTAASSAVSPQNVADHPREKSLAELRSLADHGDADAQWQMGVRYHDGEGVPQDDSQAMLWFQLAAEQGHVDAQSHLGAYYWAGRGVPKDLSKAYMWSEIALAGGDENSKSRLEGLSSQMTHAQVTAANQQAEAWVRTHSPRAKSEAN